MWFQMPSGCGGITVERQAFEIEFKDDKGQGYFRAPDHFAPKILILQGFRSVDQPEGAPADLAPEDPERDLTIKALVDTTSAQADEIRNLRSDVTAASSSMIALKNENTDLKTQITKLEAKIIELEEQLEDKPAVVTPKAK